MVIDNCHRFRASVSPTKYNPPLIINADRVPALSLASEGLQSVTRWNSQVEELFSRVDCGEFARGHARDSCEAPVAFCLEKLLGVFVAERTPRCARRTGSLLPVAQASLGEPSGDPMGTSKARHVSPTRTYLHHCSGRRRITNCGES